MKLKDVADISMGINTTRITNVKDAYTYFDLENDIKHVNASFNKKKLNLHETYEGEIIFGIAKSLAAIVSKKNSGKILSLNFIEINYNQNKIDPWFLLYYFNESNQFKRQLFTISDMRLSVSTFKNFEIDVPDMHKQQVIGNIYQLLQNLNYLMDEKKSKLKQLIDQLLKGEMKNR